MSAPPDPAIVSSSSAGGNNNNNNAGPSDPAVLAFASANNLAINKPKPNSQQGGGRGGFNNNNNNRNYNSNNNNNNNGNMIPQPRSNNNHNQNMAIPASPLPQYGGSPNTMMPPPPNSRQQGGGNNNYNNNNNNRGNYNNNNNNNGGNTTCPQCSASNHPHRYTCFKCNTALPGKERPQNNNNNRRGRGRGGGDRGARVKGAPDVNPDPEADQEFNKLYDELQRPSGSELAAQKKKTVGLLDVDRVLKTIEAHDVTFITTDTGTGKSTLVPKALYESGARVVCAESRRTATIKLAERVADLLDGKANNDDENNNSKTPATDALGKKVGYRIRGEYVGTEETPIMYMTSYTLFLWLLGNPTDFKFTHILIDEFHERPPDIEVTMSLLRLALQCRKSKPFKIVLMSATVELDAWASYFDGLKVGTYTTVIPRYPIHNMPLERTQRLLGLSTPPPNLKKETATPLEIQQALFVVKGILKYLAGKGSTSDSILVFVPGRMYVDLLCSFCEEHFDEVYDAVEWYRDVDVHDLERAFGRQHLNKRKVYIATDIAEVSVTLPDVVFVIDLCLTKKPRISGRSVRDIAFPPLETFWASQTSLAQRRGRVGRVQSGFYFNVIPEGSERLLPQTVPHICNSRVDELTMHLLQIADRPTEVLDRCFAGPSPLSLWLSRGILQDNGLAIRKDDDRWKQETFETEASLEWSKWLEETKKTDTTAINSAGLAALATTAKGKITQFLPLAVQPSLVVWSGLIFGLESLSILAAAVCAAGSPFYVFGLAEYEGAQYAKAIQNAENAMRRFQAPGVKSDVVTACHAMIQYKLRLSTMSSAELEAWLDENAMHPMRVESIIQLEKQIADQLAQQVTFFTTIKPEDLLTQLQENVRTLDALVISAFSSNSILVTRNYQEAQRAKSAGHGVFLEFGALRDRNVPSVVEWDQGQVAIPCVVQRRSEILFGYFSMSTNLTDFCAIEAMMAHTVTFHEPSAELIAEVEAKNKESAKDKKQPPVPAPRVICSFEFMTVRRAIAMEQNYAAKLRLLRDLVGLRTQQQAAMIKNGVAIDNIDRLKEVFAEAGIDARAPLPHLLSVEIRKLTNALISVSQSCQAVQLEATQQGGYTASYSTFFSASAQRYNEAPPAAEKMPEYKKEDDATWGNGEDGENQGEDGDNNANNGNVVFEEDE